jgi:hypothetical protein
MLLGLTVAATAACSDSTAPAVVASVEVAPTTSTVRAGTSVTLTATAKDASGNVISTPIAWLSSDPTVAMVDAAGSVTGVDNGSATVTAAAGGFTAMATVDVFVGTTGTWDGALTDPSGTITCPLTQSLTEQTDGSITGTGTVAAPCSAGSYTVAGNNNVGGIADSVAMTWTGPFTITYNGNYDGGQTMSGSMGGACAGCTFTMTRSSIQPTVRVSLRSSGVADRSRLLP